MNWWAVLAVTLIVLILAAQGALVIWLPRGRKHPAQDAAPEPGPGSAPAPGRAAGPPAAVPAPGQPPRHDCGRLLFTIRGWEGGCVVHWDGDGRIVRTEPCNRTRDWDSEMRKFLS